MKRRSILITGASAGLGLGMAQAFAARGCNLALCARRIDRLESLRDDLQARYPDIRVEVAELDVADHDRVFAVFREFHAALGTLDRVIVNAGIGKGDSVGTGAFADNRETLEINLIGALAQCEAAVELFRAENAGHLVLLSSMSALRGMRRKMTAYAASKAGVATLAEGIRLDLLDTPIRVTTLYPGYILTDINAAVEHAPFRVDTERGVRALVRAIEREPDEAYLPAWPWAVARWLMPWFPKRLMASFS